MWCLDYVPAACKLVGQDIFDVTIFPYELAPSRAWSTPPFDHDARRMLVQLSQWQGKRIEPDGTQSKR